MDSAEDLRKEEARWVAMGWHVRALREGRGWLQETLARKADVSVATIRALENHVPGRRQTSRTLEKLSRAFQRPRNYLSEYLENVRPEDSVARSRKHPTPLERIQPMLDRLTDAELAIAYGAADYLWRFCRDRIGSEEWWGPILGLHGTLAGEQYRRVRVAAEAENLARDAAVASESSKSQGY